MTKKIEIAMDEYIDVLEKIKERITQAQYQVMTNANVERNILFWNIGNVILQYSKWGNKFVETLSKDLRMTYPDREGYSVRNLNYMKQFARRIPSEEILNQGGAKISWRAIKLLIDKTDNLEEHMWYTQQCLENGWSSTVLAHQIESGLYYRQALADKTTNFKAQLANPFSEQAEEIIKDPYGKMKIQQRKEIYSDRNPVEWSFAIDKNVSKRRTKIDYPFIKAYRVESELVTLGETKGEIDCHEVCIYDRDRTN